MSIPKVVLFAIRNTAGNICNAAPCIRPASNVMTSSEDCRYRQAASIFMAAHLEGLVFLELSLEEGVRGV